MDSNAPQGKGMVNCYCYTEMTVSFHIHRIVPNYELAPNLEHVDILRVVVRESMTEVVRFHSFQRYCQALMYLMLACRSACC